MAKKTYISPIIDIDKISESDDHLLAGSPDPPQLGFNTETEEGGTQGGGVLEAEAKATLFDYPDYFEDEDMWELASSYTMP